LLPPTSITAPIESVRRIYDKHFARWPPHINLIYPFLASASDVDESSQLQLNEDVRARILKVTGSIEPFQLTLNVDPPGTFSHSPRSKTVWLGPTLQNVQQLQAALQIEFAECNSDSRPFIPHMSIGQASSDITAQRLQQEIQSSISDFTSSVEGSPVALDWHVDKVFLIQRKGFHDRFKIVGSIELGKE
jgi:2'-5' RNA ligase